MQTFCKLPLIQSLRSPECSLEADTRKRNRIEERRQLFAMNVSLRDFPDLDSLQALYVLLLNKKKPHALIYSECYPFRKKRPHWSMFFNENNSTGLISFAVFCIATMPSIVNKSFLQLFHVSQNYFCGAGCTA